MQAGNRPNMQTGTVQTRRDSKAKAKLWLPGCSSVHQQYILQLVTVNSVHCILHGNSRILSLSLKYTIMDSRFKLNTGQ